MSLGKCSHTLGDLILDLVELFLGEGGRDRDSISWKFPGQASSVVLFGFLNEKQDILVSLQLFQRVVEHVHCILLALPVVPTSAQHNSVILSIYSLSFKGDSGPWMNCSIISGLILFLVCWAMLTAKVAICL